LNWDFISGSDQSVGQIFAFMPQVIANALSIDLSNVMTYALQVQIPQSWSGDTNDLGTMYLAYIPQNQVNSLSLMMHTMSSSFYKQAGVAGQLAYSVVPSFPLTAVSLHTLPGGAESSDGTNSAKKTRTIVIIAISAASSSIAAFVAVWWTLRYLKHKKETKHRRLSEQSDPNWSGGVYGTHDDDRRTSFFYAHDQLQAGYYGVPPIATAQDPPPGSIGACVIQQRMRAHTQPLRRPMRQVTISAPELQFSTAISLSSTEPR